MRLILIFLVSTLLAGLSLPTKAARQLKEQDPLYLPNGHALDLLSFGYRNAVSNYLWMQTISYFGEHYRTDKQYRWLNHQCGLVTKLNPQSTEPYYLCSSLLGWEADDIPAAIAILDQAVIAHPNTWLFFYYRGFYRLYFNHDHQGAKDDFIAASERPDAHPIAARLASRSMAKLDSPEGAIEFLKSTIRSTSDVNVRNALESRMKELIYEQNLDQLDSAILALPNATHIAQLIEARLYKGPQMDPFGGSYIITEGKAASTSGHKRLSQYRGAKHE